MGEEHSLRKSGQKQVNVLSLNQRPLHPDQSFDKLPQIIQSFESHPETYQVDSINFVTASPAVDGMSWAHPYSKEQREVSMV